VSAVGVPAAQGAIRRQVGGVGAVAARPRQERPNSEHLSPIITTGASKIGSRSVCRVCALILSLAAREVATLSDALPQRASAKPNRDGLSRESLLSLAAETQRPFNGKQGEGEGPARWFGMIFSVWGLVAHTCGARMGCRWRTDGRMRVACATRSRLMASTSRAAHAWYTSAS
jgi:hypothetical protein